ncbi:hypothetical protein EDD18DRAFT_1336437 [Armillaria luteobubalina]|uniref:C3H1-type domain-containing protein n=1 Tax=Armillaria luteobubalina TaxID=153913 RepID=A0AA39PEV7_9AGAR|nr:hypothetical protein EDD18DRAFT_1336437 [Armillaria luteobubalina]
MSGRAMAFPMPCAVLVTTAMSSDMGDNMGNDVEDERGTGEQACPRPLWCQVRPLALGTTRFWEKRPQVKAQDNAMDSVQTRWMAQSTLTSNSFQSCFCVFIIGGIYCYRDPTCVRAHPQPSFAELSLASAMYMPSYLRHRKILSKFGVSMVESMKLAGEARPSDIAWDKATIRVLPSFEFNLPLEPFPRKWLAMLMILRRLLESQFHIRVAGAVSRSSTSVELRKMGLEALHPIL